MTNSAVCSPCFICALSVHTAVAAVFQAAPHPPPLPPRGRGGAGSGRTMTNGWRKATPSPLWGGLGWGATSMPQVIPC